MLRTILLLLLTSAVALRADEIHLKSGGRLIGTVEDEGDPVVLRTPGGGVIRIARDKVDRIEKKPLPPVDPADAPAKKRDVKAPPSPKHVDLFNNYAIRPPPGWRRIATSKNSKCTYAAPGDAGPFKMDVWIIKSDGALEDLYTTVTKAYRDAFKDYAAKWEKPTSLGALEARQFAGTLTNTGGDRLAHVHTLGGAKPLYYMVFFTGDPAKLDALLPEVAASLASFEILPPIDLDKREVQLFMDSYAHGMEMVNDEKNLEAVVDFEKCAELLPKHAETHQNLAILFTKLKNTKRAIEEYTTLANLRPDDPQPQFDLGTVLFQINRFPDALARFEKCLEIAPDFVDAWINIGAVRAQLGEHEKSIAAYKTAIEIDPLSTAAWFNLGQVEYIRDNFTKAREAWDRCLKIEPGHKGATDGLKRLKQEGH
ncbi:MAG: tetratricopeptide repeat protein [Planctomycetes bacterium]|nr:tetratricopeptide repeat protein [Planctomycetota bacterium]